MKRAVFTPEQQELLRQNPYTAKVTDFQIHFTAEFKQKFWEANCAGMKPTEIVRSLGYDPALIGQRRISMLAHHIRVQAKAGEEFHTGRRPAGKRPAEPETLEDTVKDLKTRLEFAEKQIEFLKNYVNQGWGRQVSVSGTREQPRKRCPVLGSLSLRNVLDTGSSLREEHIPQRIRDLSSDLPRAPEAGSQRCDTERS